MYYADETLVLDVDQHRVWIHGEEIYLPPLQWRILVLLVSQPGVVCSVDQLYTKCWPPGYQHVTPPADLVRWQILQLRRRVGPGLIVAMLKFGFKYVGHEGHESQGAK